MKKKQELLSAICTQCGMCCDGTLFNKATVKDDADKKIAESIGLKTFQEAGGKLYFQLPCHLFKGCCTIYKQSRPSVCGSFFCEPLKKLKSGNLSTEKANEIIQNALTARQEAMCLAAEIEDFKDFTVAQLFQELDPMPSEKMRRHGKLLIKLIAIRATLVGIKKK
jgi:uncharacterized protein